MSSLVLLDLDGTLTDTVGGAYKTMRDGQSAPDFERIRALPGAVQLVADLQSRGHVPVVVSDSHPRYVGPVVDALFEVPSLCLADKPNAVRTRQFLAEMGLDTFSSADTVVVGDTRLDVLLGRSLNCPTVFTRFYRGRADVRDGVGDTRRGVKAGATCIADTTDDVLAAVEDPSGALSAAEAVFAGSAADRALPFKTEVRPDGFYAVRALGRQQNGECDPMAIADRYYQLCGERRPDQIVTDFAEAARRYLHRVMATGQTWDIMTHVADKATTVPADKLSALAERVACGIPHQSVFEWADTVEGSIRTQATYGARTAFIRGSLHVRAGVELTGQNVVVLDDQITTGATADTVRGLLRARGARDILFIAMVCLVDGVPSEKTCPACGARLDVKINRNNGRRFLSCTPPQYRGTGCGKYTLNLD